MIFVSKRNKNEKLRLVGYYSDFDFLTESQIKKDLSLTGIPPENIKEMEDGLRNYFYNAPEEKQKKLHISGDVEEFIKDNLNSAKFKFVVKKQDALIFPNYNLLNVELEDLATIRMTFINYIESPNISLLIEKLENWQEFIKKDTSSYGTPYEEYLESTPIVAVKSKVMQRAGQSIFRRKVLKKDNNECKICGIKDENFLQAAHILGWKTDEIVGGDPYNGITLCLNHHKAFDLQKITFKPNEVPDENGLLNKWILKISPDLLDNSNFLENLMLIGKHDSVINFKAKKDYFDVRNDSIS